MHRIRTSASPTLYLAVRGRLAAADARQVVLDRAEARLRRLYDDAERGAQAAEYAMLGGVSAAACGALVTLLKRPDVLEGVVDAVVSVLTRTVRAWF